MSERRVARSAEPDSVWSGVQHRGLRTAAAVAVASVLACGDGSHDPHSQQAGATRAQAKSGSEHPDEHEHDGEVTLADGVAERYGIAVDIAQMLELRPTIAVPARVEFDSEAMAHVGSPIRGRIQTIRARLGDLVKAGQELAIIESPELGEAQTDYLQRRVGVESAGPVVDLAKVTWERAQGLYDRSQGVSLNEVQRREAEHRAAIAALNAAESARAAAANRLRLLGMSAEAITRLDDTQQVDPYYTLRAAIDGVVVQREITLGELVSPDREYLMILADASRLWLLADVPEQKLLSIEIGARATIQFGALADRTNTPIEGRVIYISPFVDSTTRSARVRIELPEVDIGLKPGMFAQAEIEGRLPGQVAVEPAIVIPSEAVQLLAGESVVFVPVAGEPNTYRTRVVQVGPPIGGRVAIASGLAEGETYVRSGTFILKAELGKGAAAHEH